MRNFISFYVLIVLCFTIISCKDETEISDFEVSEVTFDTKLRDVLTRKGFNFSENGELICDNQVLNTTSLDLSRCELTSISGLRSFLRSQMSILSVTVFLYSTLLTCPKE